MIEVASLSKLYGDVAAVDGVSFHVPPGTLFAFLGTNGAGKSTTIGCLTTLTRFEHGSVRVAGASVLESADVVRSRIGVVFQGSLLDWTLSVRENLLLRANLHRLGCVEARERMRVLVAQVRLEAFLDRRYGELSGGQRRRVDIARALLHRPDVLFLDEPTAGLDPGARAAVWATIRRLQEHDGLTVFLTTHYMEETESADEVCIIDSGRVVAQGSPGRLRAQHSHSTLTIETTQPAALRELVHSAGGTAAESGSRIDIAVTDSATASALLRAHADCVIDFEFRHGRMDDVFLAVTGRAANG